MHDIILYYEKLSEYCGGQENITLTVNYDKLWKLLIDKKMNRTELKDAAGISFNVLAKMGKNEFISMESLYKICSTLQCNISDIVDFELKKEK